MQLPPAPHTSGRPTSALAASRSTPTQQRLPANSGEGAEIKAAGHGSGGADASSAAQEDRWRRSRHHRPRSAQPPQPLPNELANAAAAAAAGEGEAPGAAAAASRRQDLVDLVDDMLRKLVVAARAAAAAAGSGGVGGGGAVIDVDTCIEEYVSAGHLGARIGSRHAAHADAAVKTINKPLHNPTQHPCRACRGRSMQPSTPACRKASWHGCCCACRTTERTCGRCWGGWLVVVVGQQQRPLVQDQQRVVQQGAS